MTTRRVVTALSVTVAVCDFAAFAPSCEDVTSLLKVGTIEHEKSVPEQMLRKREIKSVQKADEVTQRVEQRFESRASIPQSAEVAVSPEAGTPQSAEEPVSSKASISQSAEGSFAADNRGWSKSQSSNSEGSEVSRDSKSSDQLHKSSDIEESGEDEESGADEESGEDKDSGEDEESGADEESGEDADIGEDEEIGEDKESGEDECRSTSKDSVEPALSIDDSFIRWIKNKCSTGLVDSLEKAAKTRLAKLKDKVSEDMQSSEQSKDQVSESSIYISSDSSDSSYSSVSSDSSDSSSYPYEDLVPPYIGIP